MFFERKIITYQCSGYICLKLSVAALKELTRAFPATLPTDGPVATNPLVPYIFEVASVPSKLLIGYGTEDGTPFESRLFK